MLRIEALFELFSFYRFRMEVQNDKKGKSECQKPDFTGLSTPLEMTVKEHPNYITNFYNLAMLVYFLNYPQ